MIRALLIQRHWIDTILDGTKKWEIRGSRTRITGTIALVPSGSGTIVAVCQLVGCKGPLTAAEFMKNAARAGLRPDEAKKRPYSKTYAWVLENPIRLKRPIAYKHPAGAIIWVRIEGTAERQLRRAVSQQPKANSKLVKKTTAAARGNLAVVRNKKARPRIGP